MTSLGTYFRRNLTDQSINKNGCDGMKIKVEEEKDCCSNMSELNATYN